MDSINGIKISIKKSGLISEDSDSEAVLPFVAQDVQGVVINEILTDPVGTTSFDTDGNGSANGNDVFVEFFSTTGSDVDISGWRLLIILVYDLHFHLEVRSPLTAT